jgi:hypothetical protein
MKIAMTVKFVNGTAADIDAMFPDFIAFERERRRSVIKLEADMQLTDLAWLAWHSEKRRGGTALKFEPDWVSTVETVEVRDEGKAEA